MLSRPHACGSQVVTNQVDLFAGRRAPVDQVQKADPLLMPVLFYAGANDLSIGDIEGGEEGSGAITLVVMGRGLAASRFDRQARLGAVQCLDLTLFVTRGDDGMFGRAQAWMEDAEPRSASAPTSAAVRMVLGFMLVVFRCLGWRLIAPVSCQRCPAASPCRAAGG